MRALTLVLALSIVLAGCVGSDQPGANTTPDTDLDSETPEDQPGEQRETSGVQPPQLVDGTAFTYEATGAYNSIGTFTIVATNTSSGYHFAGATTADLHEDIMNNRPWMGELDAGLNPLDEDGEPYWRLFDWPLMNGKSWTFSETSDRKVEAERDDVPTNQGTAPGFRIQGSWEGSSLEYTYAPDVGYLTTLTWEYGETTILDIGLTDVDANDQAVWYEEGPYAATCGDPTSGEPLSPTAATVDVPADADAVVASSGSSGEGDTIVQPPPAQEPHTRSHEADVQWFYQELEGHEGSWELSARGQPGPVAPGTYVCVAVQAVTWIDLGA